MFRITDNKGFAIKFENGWSVSVQWGPGNYGSHYHSEFGAQQGKDFWESKTAEVALIHDRAWACPATGEIIPKSSDVEGYCTPERVADVIAMARALPAEFPDPLSPDDHTGEVAYYAEHCLLAGRRVPQSRLDDIPDSDDYVWRS